METNVQNHNVQNHHTQPSEKSNLSNGTSFITGSGISIIKIVLSTILYYILLHGLFYGIEQLHHNYCAPSGPIGFFQSMVTGRSHVCIHMRNLSYYASDASANMLTFLGIIFINLLSRFQFIGHHNQYNAKKMNS